MSNFMSFDWPAYTILALISYAQNAIHVELASVSKGILLV